MWRLLPLVLLVGCMATDPKQSADSADAANEPRILRIIDLPLSTPTLEPGGQASVRSFRGSGASGQVDSKGGWTVRSEVHHGRLRCAVYEVGMQLGRGSGSCTDVRWLSGVEYVTRERQCNGATRIHSGSGRFPDPGTGLGDASCVRVVVRCQGTC